MQPIGPIILIEDDEDDCFFISNAIKNSGFQNEIKTFSNGKLALNYLITMSDQPFIIFCDINMPVMDGLTLRQRIDTNEGLKKRSIPFVFLTTTNNPRQIDAAYDSTVQGFFEKGRNIHQLQETIHEILLYWKKCLHPNNC